MSLGKKKKSIQDLNVSQLSEENGASPPNCSTPSIVLLKSGLK